MSEKKARALGINHVVLEVGDLDQALEFYGAISNCVGKATTMPSSIWATSLFS
jgi:catechol-2,3-dioxygenase